VTGGLRPHGVAVDQENGAVAFINRGYQRVKGRWTMTPRLVSIAADGVVSEQDSPLKCSANDVAFAPDGVVYSFDHTHCGARAVLANVFGGGGAGVASIDGTISFEDAQFANGLSVLKNGDIAVADTRGKSIFIINDDETRNIAIGGAPDNLSVDANSGIIAAVQPSLLKFAIQRTWGRGKAGSRVIAIDPQSGRQRLLFDDPEAALFSAATIAIETPHGLVLGSPMESGLLFCRRAQ
jgi:sugar lactone lactonase YvrE